MSVKIFCLSGLAAAVLSLGVAHGQNSVYPPGAPLPPDLSPVGPTGSQPLLDGPRPQGDVPFYMGPRSLDTPGQTPPIPTPVMAKQTSWINYPEPAGCCAPTGRDGPLSSEIFLNAGPSWVVGGGPFGHALGTGWDIEGGGRLLIFNPQVDAAWTIALGLSNVNNHASDQRQVFDLINVSPQNATGSIPSVGVTIRSLNRTYANLGGGREWYLLGSAITRGTSDGPLPNWRIGFEGGGRYGTEKLETNEIQSLTIQDGGLYAAIYSDVEIPFRCCIFQMGVRMEYDYIWGDILQRQYNSDTQDVNILFTMGVRF